MQPGLYDDLPIEQYHAGPGVSRSALASYAEDPARYRFGERKVTRPQSLGRLVHTTVLEPSQLTSRYLVVDTMRLDRESTRFRRWEEQALGREVVRQVDLDRAEAMRDAVFRDPTARRLLTGEAVVERSAFWTDPGSGLLLKCRPDVVSLAYGALIDLKSARDGRRQFFAQSARNYRYHWQDQLAREGMEAADNWTPAACVFVVVESEWPHTTRSYELTDANRAEARVELRATLDRYARSLSTNTWRDNDGRVQTVSMAPRPPRWRRSA